MVQNPHFRRTSTFLEPCYRHTPASINDIHLGEDFTHIWWRSSHSKGHMCHLWGLLLGPCTIWGGLFTLKSYTSTLEENYEVSNPRSRVFIADFEELFMDLSTWRPLEARRCNIDTSYSLYHGDIPLSSAHFGWRLVHVAWLLHYNLYIVDWLTGGNVSLIGH